MTTPDDTRPGAESPASWTALRWDRGVVYALDQRRLPGEEVYLALESGEDVAQAIEGLALRGAPLIGCAAALGIALAARSCPADRAGALARALEPHFERLAATRPTAVNLSWALQRMRVALGRAASDADRAAGEVRAALLAEALGILDEDVATCRAIGAAGLPLVPEGARILTHCNAGALATAGYGTALGVVRAACAAGRKPRVLAGETRPFLQGARLTAWELARDGVPVEVITDNAAGFLMQRGEIDLVLVGADRIARNGDVANKIGTYSLAVLAREHDIPMLVAAPISSVDIEAADGNAIPIEERSREEVAYIAGRRLVPDGVPVRHPAFDITPARLVSALVTERGILRPPFEAALARAVAETVSGVTTG